LINVLQKKKNLKKKDVTLPNYIEKQKQPPRDMEIQNKKIKVLLEWQTTYNS
jgi:hypothetical protein